MKPIKYFLLWLWWYTLAHVFCFFTSDLFYHARDKSFLYWMLMVESAWCFHDWKWSRCEYAWERSKCVYIYNCTKCPAVKVTQYDPR